MNQASRIGRLPKWPMSAYSASAPVKASTMAPSETKASQRLRSRKSIACHGLSAARISGRSTMLTTPMPASTANQTMITGPNHLPMPPVPFFCNRYSPISTATVSGTT